MLFSVNLFTCCGKQLWVLDNYFILFCLFYHQELCVTLQYRQWTAWVHGKLGKKYRRPIPSCAVKEIRKGFPSASGEYKGFVYALHS